MFASATQGGHNHMLDMYQAGVVLHTPQQKYCINDSIRKYVKS